MRNFELKHSIPWRFIAATHRFFSAEVSISSLCRQQKQKVPNFSVDGNLSFHKSGLWLTPFLILLGLLNPEEYFQAIPCSQSGFYFSFPRLEHSPAFYTTSAPLYAHLCLCDSHKLMPKRNPWISAFCRQVFVTPSPPGQSYTKDIFRRAHKSKEESDLTWVIQTKEAFTEAEKAEFMGHKENEE